MIFLYAFLVGGTICALAQFAMDKFKLTPGHITISLVIIGGILDLFDIYDKLIDFAGAGALVPITSFGHSLTDTAVEGAKTGGYLGILTNMFSSTSGGITIGIILAFTASIIFKPRG